MAKKRVKKKEHPTTQYALDVLSGKIIANKWTKLACKRHKKDLKRKEIYFDKVAADDIIDFFPYFLKFYDGAFAGKPFVLTPNQKFIVGSIFGWKNKKDGFRRFRTAYIEESKGQGKSPLAGGVGLYCLTLDEEEGAEIYCLSPETRILYDDLTWRPIGDACAGDRLIGSSESLEVNTDGKRYNYRKMQPTTILATKHLMAECVKLEFGNGTSVICSLAHKWLTDNVGPQRRTGWKETKRLKPGHKIRWLVHPWEEDISREAGYIAGIFDGEGYFHSPRQKRAAFRVGFSQKPGIVWDRAMKFLIANDYTPKTRYQKKGAVLNAEIGGLKNVLRFLGTIRPTRFIDRNQEIWDGKAPSRTGWATINNITPMGVRWVVDIVTSTRTFFAEGLFSHNSAAVTREQAGILFRDARLYAESSEYLKEILIIDKHNLANEATNSFFRPIASEHRGLDGKRPHCVLIDEIHEHRDDIVVRKMSAGTKGRREALIFEITNSGYDRHSICYQHHEYTEKILEGILQDNAWFGLMSGLDVCPKCEAEGKTIPQDGCPDCDDWRDPKVWIKANPNMHYLGKPFIAYLKRQVAEAKAMPSQENIVKRLNFCCWTESITKWLPIDKWNACDFPVDPEALKGRTCYGGLDLSTNIDLTAWVMVFPPEEEDGLYEILCRFFLPEDNMMERVKRDKVPYDVWARQGYIKLTPGNIIDYAFIIAQIEQDMTDYQIAELAFDRWGSQKITTDLQDLGFEIEGKRSLVQFGQGFASMSPPTKEVETMVLKGNLAHSGNPVLSWCVSNVAIRTDPAENKKPDKEKSIERIDGAVALVMAIGRAMLRGGPAKSQFEGMSVEAIKARMSI